MKYALDANVALRWVLNEQHSIKAMALRDEFRRGLHELLALTRFICAVSKIRTFHPSLWLRAEDGLLNRLSNSPRANREDLQCLPILNDGRIL